MKGLTCCQVNNEEDALNMFFEVTSYYVYAIVKRLTCIIAVSYVYIHFIRCNSI